MPELPEVQNTVDGIAKSALDQTIISVWSDYEVFGTRVGIFQKKRLKKLCLFLIPLTTLFMSCSP